MIPLEIEKRFISLIENDPAYQDAIEIIQAVCVGQIWLIGGYLYRQLATLQHGEKVPLINRDPLDIDFLCQSVQKNFKVPAVWELSKNAWGNLSFSRDGVKVDLIIMKNLHPFLDRKDMPTVDEFLAQTPVTVNSMAMDTRKRKIIGDVGWEAVQNKVVSVHNASEARYLANMSGIQEKYLVRKTAKSLHFKAALFP